MKKEKGGGWTRKKKTNQRGGKRSAPVRGVGEVWSWLVRIGAGDSYYITLILGETRGKRICRDRVG